ncbi:MAG: hypothetical protein KatS3mg002_0378 [Candidatus Woesearchaeota archaeon]|nr:MAG: hypothetical protein KatS3mg002_0378 [Candidatus Woesearchaeota archaeon]
MLTCPTCGPLNEKEPILVLRKEHTLSEYRCFPDPDIEGAWNYGDLEGETLEEIEYVKVQCPICHNFFMPDKIILL